MHKKDQGEGIYRILLIGIGDNTEEKKESFCRNISNSYGISFPLLKEIIERCPTVLKKNLSLKKAEKLAKILKSFGATVSIEEKRDSSSISLEFRDMAPPRIALESSYLQKTQSGSWNIIGRARNISEENLNDLWVLIQLFDGFEELLTYEEVPIPINPLPPRETSPFKMVFDRDLPAKRASIAFKNSSGCPIPAIDRRKRREWAEVKLEIQDEEEYFSSSTLQPFEMKERSQPGEVTRSSNEVSQSFELETLSPPAEGAKEKGEAKDEERVLDNELISKEEDGSLEIKSEPIEGQLASVSTLPKERETFLKEEGKKLSGNEPSQMNTIPISAKEETEKGGTEFPELIPSKEEHRFQKTDLDVSMFKEANKLLEEISGRTEGREREKLLLFSWIEDFRSSIETYYKKINDAFRLWFEAYRKDEGFTHPLHSILTILAHARFNQKGQSEKALENTQRIFKLVIQSNLQLEEIPLLEGTQFFSGENWRELFHRAISKLHQVANNIVEKKNWNALDLERLIQIIPHMSDKNSRKAIRWIKELIPDLIEIDFSNMPVNIGESLYRVSSRLGVVDPYFDCYQGKNSIGDLKIQNFAKEAFPQYPLKVEEPLAWAGMMGEEGGGGYCLPIEPRCGGCLFETFCPKLYVDFNPSDKGMKAR